MPIPIPHGRLPRTAAPIIVALMQPKQRHWLTGMITSALPIAGLITMLLALAVLQLRWSMKVSEAERGRLQQNLQRSTSSFQLAFAQDLLGICQTLQAAQPREPAVLVGRLFDRYAVWHRMSRHAELIGSLYIWPQSNGRTDTLLKFNPQTRKLVPVAWPESLLSFSTQTRVRTNMLPRYSQAWVWDERVPALIHPIYALGSNKDPKRPRLFGYLFIVFSPQDFEQVYLPDLGRKYFPLSNGFVFQLIGHNGNHERRVVYQSDKHVPDVPFAHADAIIPLLDNLMPYRTAPRPPSSAMIPGVVPGPVQLSVSDISRWEISVRYRAGSVDAAVIGMRRRDLAVSAVVLVMLLVSLITILVATRRARRLAQIQMEFASEVSHELRTPLAVIRSAAENLADGVVTEGDRVRDYGVLIHKESQHLSGMVDHILDFAQMHSDVLRYRLENAAVTDIVEKVLAIERPLIQSAGVLMEVNIPDDLPMLLTNAPILQQCLQNLLSNALKYGSDGRRIFLDVSTVHENGEDRVLICVKDFGAGIAPEELSHIYEPFYRARDARDSQIRGTGLGLSLTRKMMEGLHGRITVESSPGKGSAFTLHVPVAHDKDVHALTSEPSRSG
jgi:signal transduction histidine kinase